MLPVMTTIDEGLRAVGLRAVLEDLSLQVEFARGPDGLWLGVFTMQPLSLSDLGARYLRELGLIEVLEWDDGPEIVRVVPDFDEPSGFRKVRTRSRPSRARLSTDGWAVLNR